MVRQEGGSLRRYAHIGTGNYHPKTARLYEDLGLFTADERICADLTDLFNVLTGYSRQTEYRTLLVAPQGLRPGLLARIEREIEHARAGPAGAHPDQVQPPGGRALIDALYRASQAGVRIELMVRTFCTIRAGVPGLSENITVRSILGRFLEHSRIFYFANDGEPEYWIGSADMMHRNLDRRVEVLTQVTGANTEQLRATLDLAFDPQTGAWELQPDDRWVRSGGAQLGGLPGGAAQPAGRPRRVTATASTGTGDAGGRRGGLAPGRPAPAGGGGAPAALRRLDAAQGQGRTRRAVLLAAVREVAEETGARGRGRPPAERGGVPDRRRHRSSGCRTGRCATWPASTSASDEVDELRWLTVAEATQRLTYPIDRCVLAEFARVPGDTRTLLLIRHAKAGKRSEYRGEDRLRPLDKIGRRHARDAAAVLAAFAPRRVLAADRVRCEQTVQPLADRLGLPVQVAPEFSDEAYQRDPGRLSRRAAPLGRTARRHRDLQSGRGDPRPAGRTGGAGEPYPARKGSLWVLSLLGRRVVTADYYPHPTACSLRNSPAARCGLTPTGCCTRR